MTSTLHIARAPLALATIAIAIAGCVIDRSPLPTAPSDAWVDPTIDAASGDAASGDAASGDAASGDAASGDAASGDSGAPDALDARDGGPPPCALACDGDTLLRCAGGPDPMPEPCGALGCVASPTPHCGRVIVANVGSPTFFDDATSDLSVDEGVTLTIDTSVPELDVRPMADGSSPAVVFVYRTILVAGTIQVVGSRPLILAARDAITITSTGVIDASAVASRPGPGGLAGADSPTDSDGGAGRGGDGRHADSYRDGGGGGGALCGAGGAGGGAGGAARGGVGAAGRSLGGDLLTLRGGGGGGAGTGLDMTFGRGGAGAGGIQLSTAGRLVVEEGGVVRARGGKGDNGTDSRSHAGAGGGGGAGGFVLLEGVSVTVLGAINARGGAGGAGAGSRGGAGGAGGGDGGTSGVSGTPYDHEYGNGGGGGGGAGCVTVRSLAPFTDTSAVSPNAPEGLHVLPLELR